MTLRKPIWTVFILLLLTIGFANRLLAQSNRDSVQHKRGLLDKSHNIDSARSHVNTKMDSIAKLTSRLAHFSDSLKPELSKYNRKLDSIKGKLTHRIDSLQRLNLPTGQYTHLLDSIGRAGPLKDISQAEAKLSALERKLNEPALKLNGEVNKLQNKINQKLTFINKETGGPANLPTNANLPHIPTLGLNTTIPNANLNIPSGSLPNGPNPLSGINGLQNNNIAGNLGKETSELKDITNSPQKEPSQLKSTCELGQAEKELRQVNQISKQTKGYSKDLKNLSKGNVDSVKQLNQALENKVMQNGDMKQFQSQVKGLDQYKAMAAKGNDPKAMEKLAMEQAKQQAVNHFAGKEKELQGAMSQMSKLKKKYSNLASLQDIPKRVPNAMHGKPLIERIVPGLTLQIQKKRTLLIDFNPLIGYRFTGKLTAGAGWNERVGYHHYHITHRDRIYGPRTFVEFSFAKGFSLRGEVERMNTFVPTLTYSGPNDTGSRQWVWGVFAGMKKEYKISKHIKGNVQMLYNFLDRIYKTSPYADRLNVRMGLS